MTVGKDRQLWLVSQVAKTPPFHGSSMGSIPIRATIICAIHAAVSVLGLYPTVIFGIARFDSLMAYQYGGKDRKYVGKWWKGIHSKLKPCILEVRILFSLPYGDVAQLADARNLKFRSYGFNSRHLYQIAVDAQPWLLAPVTTLTSQRCVPE